MSCWLAKAVTDFAVRPATAAILEPSLRLMDSATVPEINEVPSIAQLINVIFSYVGKDEAWTSVIPGAGQSISHGLMRPT